MSDETQIVYGRNPVRELLQAGRRTVREAWALPTLASESWLVGLRPRVADRAALGRLAGTSDHQGVVVRADAYPYADVRDALEADGPIVCLDGAQDPRNLGAICRVADAAGARAMVITARGSAGVTPAVCKTSAGAVEHLWVVRTDNIAGFLLEARQSGRQVVGAAPGEGFDYRDAAIAGDAVVVLGSEGAGLRPRVAAGCDQLVSIPMRGRVDSLNISVAAGVLLFEAGRSD